MIGKTDKEISAINKKDLYWGLYEENVAKSKEPQTPVVTPTIIEDKMEEEVGPFSGVHQIFNFLKLFSQKNIDPLF